MNGPAMWAFGTRRRVVIWTYSEYYSICLREHTFMAIFVCYVLKSHYVLYYITSITVFSLLHDDLSNMLIMSKLINNFTYKVYKTHFI